MAADQTCYDLAPEERDSIIESLAGKVSKKGLETPAVLFLEMNKPISFLAGQTLIAVSPFLAPLFGREGVEKCSKLFCKPENVELLIQRIEDLADEKDAAKRKKRSS